MKTIKDWLETIEDKELFQKVFKNNYNYSLEDEEESLSMFLNCAFSWADSPEGHEYWDKIVRDLENEGL